MLLLQAGLPVQYHRVGLRPVILGSGHEKTLAVGCVLPEGARRTSTLGGKAEGLRLAGPELRSGRNSDRHHLSALSVVIKFPTISAPARVDPVSIGDLPLASRFDSRPGRVQGK